MSSKDLNKKKIYSLIMISISLVMLIVISNYRYDMLLTSIQNTSYKSDETSSEDTIYNNMENTADDIIKDIGTDEADKVIDVTSGDSASDKYVVVSGNEVTSSAIEEEYNIASTLYGENVYIARYMSESGGIKTIYSVLEDNNIIELDREQFKNRINQLNQVYSNTEVINKLKESIINEYKSIGNIDVSTINIVVALECKSDKELQYNDRVYMQVEYMLNGL